MNETGSLDFGKVRAVIFDIDGTLSDSDDQMVLKIKGWLKPLRFMLSPRKRQSIARWLVMALESPGNFLYNLFDRFSLDSLMMRWMNRLTRNRKNRPRKYRIIPGVEEMLRELANGLPLAIVSARDEESSLAFVRQFSLEPFFGIIVTSQTCEHTKPFPEPLLYAAQKLNIEPEHCLMVGDTTVDIRAARLAGMQSLGVLCGFGTRRELLRAGADHILESTAQLIEHLRERIQELSKEKIAKS